MNSTLKNPPKINTEGRRKFSTINEIQSCIRRFKHQTSDSWTYMPRKDILKRMTHDLGMQKVFVRGCGFEELSWTLEEVLIHIKALPPPKEKVVSGSKLKNIPVFTLNVVFPNIRFAPFDDTELIAGVKHAVDAKYDTRLKEFVFLKRYHETAENHHPNVSSHKPTMESALECVFNVFHNHLKMSVDVEKCYKRTLEVLALPEYKSLNPSGVYYGLMHLLVRGVFLPQKFKNSVAWRESRNQDQLYDLYLQYENLKHRDLLLETEYLSELTLHATAIDSELCRLRIAGRHDVTKFGLNMISSYAWYFGVFQQLSEVNRQRALSGYSENIERFMHGRETMYSMGKSFAQGVAENEELREAVREQIRDAMVDSAAEILPQVREVVREESSRIIDEAREVVDEMRESAENISGQSMSKMEQLIEKLTHSLDSVMSTFESLKDLISGFFSKTLSALRSLPGLRDLDVNFDSIMKAIRDYILFVNVESTALKILVAISMLKNLGLLKVGYKYFVKLCDYLKDAGTETAGVFSVLSGNVSNIIHLVAATLASIVKGSAILPNEFWSLVKKLSSHMKEIHFIGSGCLGISRIFDFVSKIYTAVAEWISTHIFKRVPAQQEIARRVMVWIVKVKYFNSEAGMNAVRLNSRVRETASKLYAEYLSLSVELRSKPEYKLMINDVERHKRDVQNVYDYLVRLEAMSSFCPTMFHVQLVGQPGVGKSFLVKTLTNNVSKTLWPEEKPSSYSFNINLKYFDGYAGQRIFIIDDMFRMNEPEHLTTLVGLVTNTPVILPMANLSDKGTQLTSDIMITTTNTAWPIGKDVLCMEAVHRRRHLLVEVVIDPDVRDPSTGQFSKTLYLRKYREEDLPKFPHLTFNLLRPVPRTSDGDNILEEGHDELKALQEYARTLHDANIRVMTPNSLPLSPEFYFGPDNLPPEPCKLPCSGWTYAEFVSNFIVRYRAFRGLEQTYTQQRKYAAVETAISELEALFSQNSDIPSGVYFPTKYSDGENMRLVEKWFTDIHHPYGTSDPIGERIAESPDSGLAPELSEIDFDQLVDETLRERRETVLTLEEERRRTRAIRERNQRLRNQQPVQIREMLRLERDGDQYYVPLNPFCTVWDGWDSYQGPSVYHRFTRLHEANILRSLYVKILQLTEERLENAGPSIESPNGRIALEKGWQFANEMMKYSFSATMYYPDRPEFGPMSGSDSGIPLYFLQALIKKNGRWALDVTKIHTEHLNILGWKPHTVVFQGIQDFVVPIDIAFMLSVSSTFRTFCINFDNLNTTQQEMLVEEAKWRNMWTGFYTLEKLKEDCRSSLMSGVYQALSYLMTPLTYLLDRMPIVAMWIGQIAMFGLVVWSIRSVARLVLGEEKETSKYLHRGPQSNIMYHGRLTSAQLQEEAFVQKMMNRHVKRVQLTDETGNQLEVQAILDGRYLYMPKHAIRGLQHPVTVSMALPGTNEWVNYCVPLKNFVEDPESDLCCVTCRTFPQAASLTKKFVSEEELSAEFSGTFALLSRFQGNSMVEVHPYSRRVKKPKLRLPDGAESTIDQALIVSGPTVTGKSGSMAVHFDPQHQARIVGIQVWAIGYGYSPEIAIQIITTEKAMRLQQECNRVCEDLIHKDTFEEVFEPVDVLDGVFTSQEVNQVVGMVPVQEMAGIVGKTQFKPTPIARLMDRDGFQSQRCPAALSAYDPRLRVRMHPLSHSIHKYVRGTVTNFSSDVTFRAKQSAIIWIKSVLDKSHFRSLTLEETLTGTREDGSNPMNLGTSPGIPFIFDRARTEAGKRHYFKIDELGQVSHIDQDIRSEYQRFVAYLGSGQLPFTRTYDFPKDELRPINKVVGTENSPPKTRTVTCMNMFFVLAWRQETLDFWAAMHRAADGTFPFCPGINPEGPEWSEAFHYLNRHPHVVDFDVPNWDGLASPDDLHDVADIIIEIIQPSPEGRNVIRAVITEVVTAYIQYGRTVYQKSRGMVSGFPGTAEVNTLLHLLILIKIWFKLTKNRSQHNSLDSFMHNVSSLVYGDDIIISFSSEVSEWFNGKTIQAEYVNIGYPVTSADKSAEVVAYKTIFESQFLKSSWRRLFSHVYVRKMDSSVAYDLLYWERAKADVQEQFMTNAIDALRIMFGHGRKEYNQFLEKLNRWLRECGLAPILYSYDDHVKDHLDRYYSIEYKPL